MQSLGDLGKLELSTRDLLQLEREGNCVQERSILLSKGQDC